MEPILENVLKNIRHTTRDFPGILVENKRFTGAVHYRLADPVLWKPLKGIIRKEVERTGQRLKMTEGKRVLEIKPNVPWDKGKGIQKLMGWLDPKTRSSLVFIGDDQTDEDAFMAVNRLDRNGITIHVGRTKETRARYRLANVNEVWIFLRALLPLIIEFSGGGL
jgi:trehalose 6-phosphate phosphatase